MKLTFLVITFVYLYSNLINANWFHNKKGAALYHGKQKDSSITSHILSCNGKNKEVNYNFKHAELAKNMVESLNPHWYYNWSASPFVHKPQKGARDMPFYPMVWTHSQTNKYTNSPVKIPFRPCQDLTLTTGTQLDLIVKQQNQAHKQPYVLLYNEPDHPGNPTSPDYAAQIFNSSSIISKFNAINSNIVSPVPADYSMDLTWGTGPYKQRWLDDLFLCDGGNDKCLNSEMRDILKPFNKPFMAMHIYPDPISDMNIPRSFLMDRDHPQYQNTVRRTVDLFVRHIHAIKRKYNAKLFITEFGLEDNCYNLNDDECKTKLRSSSQFSEMPASQETDLSTYRSSSNHIPSFFLEDVYSIILDEFSSRDYILKFSALTPVGIDYKARYIVNSGFKSKSATDLTEVGKKYSDYTYDNNCQKGEYKVSPTSFVEYFSIACGAPTEFGWSGQGLNNNGWVINRSANRYQRTLNIFQIRGFEWRKWSRSNCFQTRYRERYKSYGSFVIKELVHENCLSLNEISHFNRNGSPWIYNQANGQYSRRYFTKTQRVGIMGHYF